MSLRLFSPAKINLFLRVIRKRPDQYHDISSLFQAISLGDILTIRISKSGQDSLICQNPNLICDESNLIHKAIQIYRQKTGISNRFDIQLEKKIPIEAGLGGGSSNAATTLWGCNQLCGENASVEELMQWGSEIGSDIPFFFSEGTAFCTGRGENVMNLPSLPFQKIQVYMPKEGLSTAEVFKRLEIPIDSSKNTHDEIQPYLNGSFDLFNDLETPAFQINPRLKILKDRLISYGFKKVLMTGSGTAFFCMGGSEETVPQNQDLEHFSAHFINRKINEWYSIFE